MVTVDGKPDVILVSGKPKGGIDNNMKNIIDEKKLPQNF